jgi:hypothetical protein
LTSDNSYWLAYQGIGKNPCRVIGMFHVDDIVSGWWFQLLWKIWFRQLGLWNSQYDGKTNPNLPNHQPVYHPVSTCILRGMTILSNWDISCGMNLLGNSLINAWVILKIREEK